ncbi:uncharacterized protein LOC123523668 [Mercenaria mercenaria]|uniref:uncharacterized protein LOC123523668 n=1 Tax=Mercenaria mercenaria TaxID=6596 RepID=UPI00234EACE3|nr:uncharacterized protein LOC123523668 [Mercenaria mercenaria]
MWNSPNKLLFFDEEDFIMSSDKDDVTQLEESGRTESEMQRTSVSSAIFTQTTTDEISFTTMDYNMMYQGYVTSSLYSSMRALESAKPRTALPESSRVVLGRSAGYSLPNSLSMYSQRHRYPSIMPEGAPSHHSGSVYTQSPSTTNSARLRFEPVQVPILHVASAMIPVTRSLVATERSAERPLPVPISIPFSSLSQQLQQTFQNQPEQLVSQTVSQQINTGSQSELSELQRLQFEAIGTRPRSSAVPTSRQRLVYDDTSEEDSSFQNLCNLMEIQAQVSLRHSRSDVNPGFISSMPSSLATPCVGLQVDRSRNSGKHCNFCKRNGERRMFVSSHNLQECGRVTCPVLQRYICPLCGATGESAHTVSYCPLGSGTSSVAATRTLRKACGCKRACKHGEENRH